MNAEILSKAKEYIKNEKDSFFKNEIENLISTNNDKELSDRFYKDLDFGTGGMRGEIGGGYNRMNVFTIQRATQGLATYINKSGLDKSAVIAYDSRRYSETFAKEAALVLCANGIKTYLFTSLRPTPELSFAVRYLKATSGIVITASHNPKEYNGYKVYWNDGGQIVPPHDKGIIGEVRNVKNISNISEVDAIKNELLKMIDKEVDEPFINTVISTSIRPNLIKEKGKEVKVVYTPLNGAGGFLVSTTLSRMGIDVIFVPEQKDPDGNFPTTPFPNPEEKEAMELSLKLGKKIKADLVMGTDPDADRIGIGVPDKNGEFVLITGNQLGALLADYIFGALKESGKMPKNPMLIKTIVTSEFQRKIAESYNAKCVDVLTGFKFIGEKIKEFENDPKLGTFVLGGEESYGYLIHTKARDKDAVSAATMSAELALYYRSKNMSIMDRLAELWKEHGYYEEILVSKYFKGEEGTNIMNKMMNDLRTNPPAQFADKKVLKVLDYKTGFTTYIAKNTKEKDILLPASDVIQLLLDDETIITARPSGTEPKIKFYASICSKPNANLEAAILEVKNKIVVVKENITALVNKA